MGYMHYCVDIVAFQQPDSIFSYQSLCQIQTQPFPLLEGYSLRAFIYLFISCGAFCVGEKIVELSLQDNVIPGIATRIELNSTKQKGHIPVCICVYVFA